MNLRAAFLVWGAMTTGAHASSFVVLEQMTKPFGPSMVALGSAAAAPGTDRAAAAQPFGVMVPLAYPVPGGKAGEDGRKIAGAILPPAAPKQAPGSAERDGPAYQIPVPRILSRSIIAFGDVQPPVSDEKFASIGPTEPDASGRRPQQTPMVIRGGLIGDAFARPAAAASAASTGIEAKAPETGGDGRKPAEAPAKRETPPAAPPAEPPTRKPE